MNVSVSGYKILFVLFRIGTSMNTTTLTNNLKDYLFSFINICLHYYTSLKDRVIQTLYLYDIIEGTDKKYRYKITSLYITNEQGGYDKVDLNNNHIYVNNFLKTLSFINTENEKETNSNGLLFYKEDHSDRFVINDECIKRGGLIKVHYDLILNETGEYKSYIFIYENTKENRNAFPPHSDDELQEYNNTPNHKKRKIIAAHFKEKDSNDNDDEESNKESNKEKDIVDITEFVREFAGPFHDFYNKENNKGAVDFNHILRHVKITCFNQIINYNIIISHETHELVITDSNMKEHKYGKEDRIELEDAIDIEIIDFSKLNLDFSLYEKSPVNHLGLSGDKDNSEEEEIQDNTEE